MANWTLSDLMIVASAREIKDGDVIFAGVGKPVLSALLAKLTFAPNAVICTESGSIGPVPDRLMLGIGDNAGIERAFCCTSLWRLFADQQRGYVDIGMVGGAQVDKYGNLNSTEIFGDGDYYNPKIRFTGSGGANDIASCAGRTVITMPMQADKFVNKIDYCTSPGWMQGGNTRAEVGLTQGGPAAVITDKCIFRFTEDTHELYLASVHPGADIEKDIKPFIPWDLIIPENVPTTEVPTDEECEIIKALDPGQYYTGAGLKNMTWENYVELMDKFINDKLIKENK